MKSTGIVRRVDDLGRIVLPKELRMVLHISERDPLEIFVEGNCIMLQKYESGHAPEGEKDRPASEKEVASTGIVRKVDDLGRIVLPKELRTMLYIRERDPLEIFVNGTAIMLRKYESSCIFCGSSDQIELFRGKNVCSGCTEEISRLVKR